MHRTICEGSFRSRVGVAAFCLMMFFTALFLLQNIYNGYWLTGAYGFSVPPAFALTAYLLWKSSRVVWHHSIRGTDWIFLENGHFHLAAPNHEAVDSNAVKSVAIEKRGLHRCLTYRGKEGEELRTMPLTLSTTPADLTLKRARGALRTNLS